MNDKVPAEVGEIIRRQVKYDAVNGDLESMNRDRLYAVIRYFQEEAALGALTYEDVVRYHAACDLYNAILKVERDGNPSLWRQLQWWWRR